MRERRAAWFAVVVGIGGAGCGQPSGGDGDRGAAVASAVAVASAAKAGAAASAAKAGAAAPEPRLARLSPEERRVPLFVLPGDALVEVSGQPMRRRQGVIELQGKVGQVFSVRVRKGEKSTEEKEVKITEAGASPSVVDLNEPPRQAARGAAKAAPKSLAYDE
jgi:eukaryotic-like serine/threonine-protein kinase